MVTCCLRRILRISSMGPVKTFSHHRLLLLEQKFNLHVQLNADKEFLAQKSAPHRDFYNVRKVQKLLHCNGCSNGCARMWMKAARKA